MSFITLLLPFLGEAGEMVGAILSAIAGIKALIWVGHTVLHAVQARRA
jgi:hypothetical protein